MMLIIPTMTISDLSSLIQSCHHVAILRQRWERSCASLQTIPTASVMATVMGFYRTNNRSVYTELKTAYVIRRFGQLPLEYLPLIVTNSVENRTLLLVWRCCKEQRGGTESGPMFQQQHSSFRHPCIGLYLPENLSKLRRIGDQIDE